MEWIIEETKNLEKYKDEIFKMYADSYKDIGLIDFGGWDGLKDYLNCSYYLLVNETRNINGIILYWLSDFGNKIALVISASPDVARMFVIPKLYELLRTKGFYVELSDALEYLMRKQGLDNIKDKTLIKQLIPNLKDEDIFDEDDERRTKYMLNRKYALPSPSGSYLRHIKDIGIHRKALYGLPCLEKVYDKSGCDRTCVSTGGKTKKSIKAQTQKHSTKTTAKSSKTYKKSK